MSASRPAASGGRGTAPRVLVVDRDLEARRRAVGIVERVARHLGLDIAIDQAGDGTTALALCSDHRPRLVVTEILLEGLSGLALMRRLHGDRNDGDPPVVLVTAMARETDRYWGLRNGAHAYVTKPYDDEELAGRVRRLLADGAKAAKERP